MPPGRIWGNTFRTYGKNMKSMLIFVLLLSFLGNLLLSAGTSFMTQQALRSVDDPYLQHFLHEQGMEGLAQYFYQYYYSHGSIPEEVILLIVGELMTVLMTAALLSILFSLLISPLVSGGIANVTLGYCHGVAGGPKDWLRRTAKYYGKLVGTGGAMVLSMIGIVLAAMIPLILMVSLFSLALGSAMLGSGGGVILAMLLGFLFLAAIIFFGLFLSAWMGMVYPVAAGEATFGFAALGRAFRLVRKALWKSIGTFFLLEFTVGVLSWLLSRVLGYLLGGFAYTVASLLVSSLLMPVAVIGGALLYLDIRITREGYAATLPGQDGAPEEAAPAAPVLPQAAPEFRAPEPPAAPEPEQRNPSPVPPEPQETEPTESEEPKE